MPAFKFILILSVMLVLLLINYFNHRRIRSRPLTSPDSLPPPLPSIRLTRQDLRISRIGRSELAAAGLAEFLLILAGGALWFIGGYWHTNFAILALALSIFPLYNAYCFYSDFKFLTTGIKARGVVIGSIDAGRGSRYVYFDFLDSSGKVVRGYSGVLPSETPEDGTTVILYYLPQRPRRNRLQQSLVLEKNS